MAQVRDSFGSEGAYPPLANRGGGTPPPWKSSLLGKARAVQVDAGTWSMSPELWDRLVSALCGLGQSDGLSWHLKRGRVTSGKQFARIEPFDLISSNGDTWQGGAVERRNPTGTPSKRFGLDVVNVEAWGHAAGVIARVLAQVGALLVDCSRFDIAFDWDVLEHVMPHDIVCGEGGYPWTAPEVGTAGPLAKGTRYIHRGSERSFMRWYRRDFKEDSGVTDPVMRGELQVNKALAPRFWALYCAEGLDALLAAATAEIEHRTGMQIDEPKGVVLAPVAREESKLPRTLAAGLKQYGPALLEAFRAGLTRNALEQLIEGITETCSRNARMRQRSREWSGTTLQLREAIIQAAKAQRR